MRSNNLANCWMMHGGTKASRLFSRTRTGRKAIWKIANVMSAPLPLHLNYYIVILCYIYMLMPLFECLPSTQKFLYWFMSKIVSFEGRFFLLLFKFKMLFRKSIKRRKGKTEESFSCYFFFFFEKRKYEIINYFYFSRQEKAPKIFILLYLRLRKGKTENIFGSKFQKEKKF